MNNNRSFMNRKLSRITVLCGRRDIDCTQDSQEWIERIEERELNE